MNKSSLWHSSSIGTASKVLLLSTWTVLLAGLQMGCTLPAGSGLPLAAPVRDWGQQAPAKFNRDHRSSPSAVATPNRSVAAAIPTAHPSDRHANPLRFTDEVAQNNAAGQERSASPQPTGSPYDPQMQTVGYAEEIPTGTETGVIENVESGWGDPQTIPAEPDPHWSATQSAELQETLSSQPTSAQGHFQDGTPIYGRTLNTPPQPASARATELHQENQRLRAELESKTRWIAELESRWRDQQAMWTRAQADFDEVRQVVNQLNGQNTLLAQEVQKLRQEKVNLEAQYQQLFESVEQTLDELLFKAIAEPPPAPSPPTRESTAPATPEHQASRPAATR